MSFDLRREIVVNRIHSKLSFAEQVNAEHDNYYVLDFEYLFESRFKSKNSGIKQIYELIERMDLESLEELEKSIDWEMKLDELCSKNIDLDFKKIISEM